MKKGGGSFDGLRMLAKRLAVLVLMAKAAILVNVKMAILKKGSIYSPFFVLRG
jgi:hypothetical protein